MHYKLSEVHPGGYKISRDPSLHLRNALFGGQHSSDYLTPVHPSEWATAMFPGALLSTSRFSSYRKPAGGGRNNMAYDWSEDRILLFSNTPGTKRTYTVIRLPASEGT